ncbi:MAG: ABC transporter ATP-binding protein/permease [Betaproteobacteria bacterium]|nr:ABC transporter ATP-binding protein/permease [Betaproteobacteria bacterium]
MSNPHAHTHADAAPATTVVPASAASAAASAPASKSDWRVIRSLVPYLWDFRWRVALALTFLVTAKLANIGVPLLLKEIVDSLDRSRAVLAVPFALLAAYGLLRLSSTLFGELRDIVFIKVTQRAMRRIALSVFRHLHALSLRFHLERQTGGVTRDIERGTRGVSTLMSFMLFSVIPILLEITLVTILLAKKFDIWFVVITLCAILLYAGATIGITEWRTAHRRRMNEMDSKANTKAIDSLLNYETVKYFGNEEFEAGRYDKNLQSYEAAATKSETSLGLLNVAQSCVIATAVTLLMWRASDGVVNGSLTLGDLVMVNALLIQLYIPLNFLGVMYREIKQALTDMEKMFRLLGENREIADKAGAKGLAINGAAIRFENVDFAYDPKRQILHGVSFDVPAGHTVAVVGSSGAGKSTLSRLLFRFYDIQKGSITIDGQDIRDVTQNSVRASLGIVPQDTVLFNDTIRYNIAYGRPGSTDAEIEDAARRAHVLEFIERLPDRWEAMVGERGLKLSGGEKQRVAIARTLLKNPSIMIFDEATSALDSKTEKAIQAELREIAEDRTTLVIAHRLSTIIDADQILVLEHGRIVERGNFRELIDLNGKFAEMWQLQQQEERAEVLQLPANTIPAPEAV